MNINDLQRRVLGSVPSEKLLLDEFPNAAAAYSLRLLRKAYTGNCIEVRRSSDNALQDIGFVNGVLDTASLLSFVGAGDGFVRTWYDQSGNGRNAVQTDNARQPPIILNGVLNTLNSKPSIQGITGNIMIFSPNIPAISNGITSFFAVNDIISIASNQVLIGNNGSVGSYNINYNNSRPQIIRQNVTVLLNGAIVTPNTPMLGSFFTTESNASIHINSILNSSVNRSISFTQINSSILSQNNDSNNFQSKIQEMILFLSNESANRTAIEQNINAFYNIF